LLLNLSIRDILIVRALDLDFAPGLTVLTGETGSGKSILLDCLGLALGWRGRADVVRPGAPTGEVSATFALPPDHPARAILAEAGLPAADDTLILRRQVAADGRRSQWVNDRRAGAETLRALAETLVELHGQHDERGLLNPRGHRALLDAFGRCDTTSVSGLFAAWQDAKAKLESAREALENAARDREWLEHAVTELRRFAPQEGEEESLAGERADMQKGERIAEDLRAVLEAFEGSESGLAKLRSAARKLDRVANEHPLLAEALTALDRAVIEASEAEDKLIAATQALSFDPERLDAIEVRLFDLRGLARKHNVRPEELAQLTEELAAKLDAIEAGGEGIAKLEANVARHGEAYRKAASALSAQRKEAAKRLDAAVAGELAPLKLDAAKFQTAVEELPEDRWTATGMDRVEFLISTNPGAPFAPLAKIASGGELSRFILALKVALAEEGGAATIIFDEIDRGVGGAVASAIGERLARLAGAGKQLLAVTHSPQVAAKGQSHYFIAKSSEGTVTRTGVTRLDPEGRRQEIARMLSGAEITDEARAQAARLMEGV